MHFTREPIIETIVTPKDGHKLLVRSSKIAGAEEYFVDALEIVSFGTSYFYRSTEKPKPFLLSVTDYEVVEARETKIALKTSGVERGIKIGGGKESSKKEALDESQTDEIVEETRTIEKKRDRKRNRRRRGRSDEKEESVASSIESADPYDSFMDVSQSPDHDRLVDSPSEAIIPPSHNMHILLPPPPALISETFGKHAPKEEQQPPLPEAPQSPAEKIEELMDDITED